MTYFNYRFKKIFVGIFLSFYSAVPVLAEDIEIYKTVGGSTGTIQPNVLFVIDTSGSMSNNNVTISEAYDPAKTYPSSGCGTNRIYWNRSGSPPSCGSGDYFYSSALNCDRAWKEYDASGAVISANGPLLTQGFYADDIAQKRGATWRRIRTNTSSRRSLPIECSQDQGVHGSNAAPTPNMYIRNNSTAWGGTRTISGWPGRYYTLYTSNYMNYLNDSSSNRTITRFQAVKEAIVSVVNASNDINIGLMGFNGYGGGPGRSPDYDGGQVRFAMEDIDTAKTAFINYVLDPNFRTNSWTPLSETYFEAIHYFGGKTPPYGTSSYATPVSVPESLEADGTYLSPIINECQQNHIVFLTDGDPTRDTLSTSQLASLPGFSDFSCASTVETTSEGNQSIIESNCLDRLSAWAYNNDVAEEASAAHDGTQKIITNTIGFGNGLSPYAVAMLQRTATGGGGSYYEAQNPDDLVQAFTQFISEAKNVNTSFTSPAVSVNAFNRSVHLDDLYFTLFKPASGPHWQGNFKKYKLDFFVDSGDVDNDNDRTELLPFIADAAGNNAVSSNGFFDSNARSYWSVVTDGEEVAEGGAVGAYSLRTGPRDVYTFTGNYTNTNGVFVPSTSVDLTSSINRVEKSNTAITEAMLDIVGQGPSSQLPPTTPSNTPLIETLLDWASGLDVFSKYGTAGTTSDQRLDMGDPLHSQPALVQYGGSAANPDLVAYVATNDGYLHAYDVDDGSEIFSFVPQELLPNLNVLMDDSGADKTYGLDGNVVAWINDKPDVNGDRDGIINGTDSVYLYIGMRRGGNNIYSIDVTDRLNPKLRWVIKGGVGDYAELGQTWSNVNVAKVKDATDPSGSRTVLIFGGGYDLSQDNAVTRTPDSTGRAVYIADATSGQLLWSAGPGGNLPLAGEMKYSVPARVTPLDISGDGNIDRLYAADMGGQIFRFDIDESKSNFTPASITGGRIADLSEDNSPADTRRFYYPPDVALIAERGKQAYLALAITSGYRAHPNNIDAHDRIYLLKDKNIYNAPSSYVTLTEADLYNATANLAGGEGVSGTDKSIQNAAKALLDTTEGWYVFLDDETSASNWLGEKGLSEALILEGTIIVTTYTPFDPATAPPTNSCTANEAGTGKVFFMNVIDATPVVTADTDMRPGRHLYGVAKSGIPPTPTVIVTKGGEPTLCVGTECKAADLIKGVRKTFWYEVEK
ncbi:MAG TPA: hypothetical protein ENJ08_02550 [Gammaproteobacteria bacterium]|nr:hypothetical protein [Gammaproteobacteria bacterium]